MSLSRRGLLGAALGAGALALTRSVRAAPPAKSPRHYEVEKTDAE